MAAQIGNLPLLGGEREFEAKTLPCGGGDVEPNVA